MVDRIKRCIRVNIAVVGQQQSDLLQRHIHVITPTVQREDKLAEAFKRRMVYNVTDRTTGFQRHTVFRRASRTLPIRYFIASIENDAALALRAVRRHWGIENELHWVLDIAFREDDCRVRKDFGPQNFAVLRHIALNLLKQDTATKLGVKNKRLQAAWDETYLLTLLSQ